MTIRERAERLLVALGASALVGSRRAVAEAAIREALQADRARVLAAIREQARIWHADPNPGPAGEWLEDALACVASLPLDASPEPRKSIVEGMKELAALIGPDLVDVRPEDLAAIRNGYFSAEEMAMGDWRPMETAPEDGTEVLVADAQNVVQARCIDGSWWEHNNDSSDAWGRAVCPDHWMPLPPPPNAPAPKGAEPAAAPEPGEKP